VIGLIEIPEAGDLDGHWGEISQQVGQACGLHILMISAIESCSGMCCN
jgi:hypothetical protein